MLIGCGGDINQSDFVGLRRSTWRSTQVYMGLRRGLHGSMQVYVEQVYAEVYAGLRGGLRGSMQVYVEVYVGLHGAGEHYPIKICANDVIGCDGDINQSDFVGLRRGLCGSTWVYAEVYMGLCGSTWV